MDVISGDPFAGPLAFYFRPSSVRPTDGQTFFVSVRTALGVFVGIPNGLFCGTRINTKNGPENYGRVERPIKRYIIVDGRAEIVDVASE